VLYAVIAFYLVDELHMKNQLFYFNKSASRIVAFSMSQYSLHYFTSEEWVITVNNFNQWAS